MLRVPPPRLLVRPVAVDPTGVAGPTAGEARGPSWRRSSPRLYVRSEIDRTVVEQRILEESSRLPNGGAVTGWAALRLHGVGYFDGLEDDGSTERPVDLVVPNPARLRAAAGVRVHRDELPAEEATLAHGIPAATPERAAFDAARASPLRHAVIVL